MESRKERKAKVVKGRQDREIRKDRLKRITRTWVEPASEENMERLALKGTICGQLRQVYKMIDNEEVKIKIRVAITMAQKMNKKLDEYHTKFGTRI